MDVLGDMCSDEHAVRATEEAMAEAEKHQSHSEALSTLLTSTREEAREVELGGGSGD